MYIPFTTASSTKEATAVELPSRSGNGFRRLGVGDPRATVP